jgi:hypothetical protein
MIALLRYLAADTLRSQRWLAPLLAFLVAVAIIAPSDTSPLLPTATLTAVALLPVGLWLTVVVNHSEDPVQVLITVVTIGNATRVRLAKLLAAYLACCVLTVVAVIWTLTTTEDPLTPGLLTAVTLEHLVTALTGVGLGALISRPLLTRTGWIVLLGTGIALAEVLVPHLPPANPQLSTFGDHPPANPWPTLLAITAQSAVLSLVAVAVAQRAAKART